MRILVVGSGGREHAICHAFNKSARKPELFCADGNAGIAEIAECVPIKTTDIGSLADFAVTNSIDLTFVGGETSLALGISDEFAARDLAIVGVSKSAARLESSKSFAKDFMARHAIPTAKYKTAYSISEARQFLENGDFGDESEPVVVKADGLAAGKGVVVAPNRAAALEAVGELAEIVGAEAAETIVLEECMTGREVSLLMFSDGESFALMPPVRDHKRIGEGDTGPNTGGMGTVSSPEILTAEMTAEIVESIVKPTLAGARGEGFPIRGILFVGLMLTPDGPRVLEYNVRFGDPETQVLLVQLESDLVEICEAIVDGRLGELELEWHDGAAACVVLAAENYPAKPRTGDEIIGLGEAGSSPRVEIFHAGTGFDSDGKIVTSGGRVLGVTARDADLPAALWVAYDAVSKISWRGMQYRRDIGK